AVEVPPAGRDEAEPGIGIEDGDGAAEEVWLRHEVGVENRDIVAAGHLQAVMQCPGLESTAFAPAHVDDVDALPLPVRDPARGKSGRFVRRIVEDLDLELSGRIIEPGTRVDDPLDHKRLIVDRQLDGDLGPGFGDRKSTRLN